MVRKGTLSAPGLGPAIVPPDAAAATPTEAPPSRVTVVLRSGRTIVVEGAMDPQAVLALARGLEALR